MFARVGRLVVTLSLLTGLSACALSQPSPPAGDARVSDVDVSQAIADEALPMLDTLTGELSAPGAPMVRWGGTIADISNQADGSTLLEIVSRPLLGGGRPIHDDRSDGRFLAVYDRFLDPEIVTSGRDMTVLGELVARHSGQIGESDYVFPVVAIQDLRIWKPVVIVPVRPYPHWSPYPPFGRYDPFRRDWPFGDRRPRGERR